MPSVELRKIIETVNLDFENRGVTPYQINNGYCNEWADTVFEEMAKTDSIVEEWETIWGFSECSHSFIRVDGRFYDAECTMGVNNYMELPIFSKVFGITMEKVPVWLVDYSSNGYWDFNKFNTTPSMIEKYNAENGTNHNPQVEFGGRCRIESYDNERKMAKDAASESQNSSNA